MGYRAPEIQAGAVHRRRPEGHGHLPRGAGEWPVMLEASAMAEMREAWPRPRPRKQAKQLENPSEFEVS